jgi:hypothetical protein
LLKLDVQRSISKDFNLLQARLNGENITTITGDRTLTHNGNMQIVGGLSIAARDFSEVCLFAA